MVLALPLSAVCKAVPQTAGEPEQVTVHSWQTPATQSWVAEQLHDGGFGGDGGPGGGLGWVQTPLAFLLNPAQHFLRFLLVDWPARAHFFFFFLAALTRCRRLAASPSVATRPARGAGRDGAARGRLTTGTAASSRKRPRRLPGRTNDATRRSNRVGSILVSSPSGPRLSRGGVGANGATTLP